MGQAKKTRDRRAEARKVPLVFANRWVVVGVDRHGEPFLANDDSPTDTSASKAEAERIAAGVNRRGGRVQLVECYWDSSYVGYIPVGETKRTYPSIMLSLQGLDTPDTSKEPDE